MVDGIAHQVVGTFCHEVGFGGGIELLLLGYQ